MRTKTLLAATAMLAAGLASSMAQSNVYSLNVVGYVNKVFKGGGLYTLVSNPLNTTNNTLASVFSALPAGSQIQKWGSSGNTDFFPPYIKTPLGWGANAAVTVNPGEGFFVKISGADYTNTFVGEVLQGNLTNATVSGFNLIGDLVPRAGNAPTIGLVPNNGSQVQKWNENAVPQDFFPPFTKTPVPPNFWGPSIPSFEVAEGFFLNNTTGPYNWGRTFTVQP